MNPRSTAWRFGGRGTRIWSAAGPLHRPWSSDGQCRVAAVQIRASQASAGWPGRTVSARTARCGAGASDDLDVGPRPGSSHRASDRHRRAGAGAAGMPRGHPEVVWRSPFWARLGVGASAVGRVITMSSPLPVPAGSPDPRVGCVVEEDHFLTRMGILLLSASGLSCLIALALSSRAWVARLIIVVGCLAVVIVAAWTMIRCGRRHLVLAVDQVGVHFGPGLWEFIAGHEVDTLVTWDQIREVGMSAVDYSAEPHVYSLIRNHLWILHRDGRRIERALPAGANVTAVVRAVRASGVRLIVEGRLQSAGRRWNLPTPRGPGGP